MKKNKTLFSLVFIILLVVLTIVPISAQDDIIVISIAMPEIAVSYRHH